MFQKTRLSLTGWYLLILMLVSGLFSTAIYVGINHEFTRMEYMQKARLEREKMFNPLYEELRHERELQGRPLPPLPGIELEAISEARTRLQVILVFVNLGILGVGGLAGYFLAGRTLKPIKDMIDEQNRFITDASHELRTPLTSLKSEIEVGLRDKTFSLNDAKKLLQSNLEDVNILQSLSDGLIKLTQYQQNNDKNLYETVSIAIVVGDAQKKVASLAKSKKIIFINRVRDTMVEAIRQSLTEMFVIFFDNAIKYSEKNTTVRIESHLTDHSVVIDVKDQGIGIDKKDIPHIFDRFYRVDTSRSKTDVLGYGLGLSIAKQIVKKHKGNITIESKVGKGTSISVQIPRKY